MGGGLKGEGGQFFKCRVHHSPHDAVTQSDMLEIHNIVVNNYQYDTEMLDKYKALT